MVRMKRRPFPAAVGILGILTAMLFFTAGCGKGEESTTKETDSSENVVLYLNDDAVSKEEYEMLAGEYCNEIYMQYTTEQINDENFWEEEMDGIVPYAQLEEIIREELTHNYALKALAVELEVTDDYTYQDLMTFMEEENTSGEDHSQADTSDDEVSYGLTSFDEATYYKYWYSNLETQVLNTLIQEKTDISEEDCREYYDENPESFTYETGVSILYAEIPYDSEEQRESAQAAALQLRHAMENTESVSELEEAFEEASIEQLELNSLDTQEGMSGIYSQRWELASQLAEGEVYGAYEQDGAFCIIKCIGRTENELVDFGTVQAQIERYLQQQEAQKLIDQEEESLEVKDGKITEKEAILEAVAR